MIKSMTSWIKKTTGIDGNSCYQLVTKVTTQHDADSEPEHYTWESEEFPTLKDLMVTLTGHRESEYSNLLNYEVAYEEEPDVLLSDWEQVPVEELEG